MSKYLVRSAMVVSLAAVALAFALPARAQQSGLAAKKGPVTGTAGAAGTIESIDAAAGTVTIKTANGGTMTFTCDAACRFTNMGGTTGNGPAALKDLKIGDKAVALCTEKDGKPACYSLRYWPPPHQSLLGTITSIDAATGTVTIKDAGSWTATFTCAADCTFETNGGANKHAALSDLKVGDKVSAVCAKENGKVVCHDLVGQQKSTP